MMGHLTHPKLIYLKGALFLLGGTLASAAILLEHPTVRTSLLLSLAVWCFARFYYFCFYVIHHYVDPAYGFSGLWSFARYLAGARSTEHTEAQSTQREKS